MGTDTLLSLYFQGLYPTDEFNKIDLSSRNFYLDSIKFYSKNATPEQRQEFIAGIKYLFQKIRIIDEFEQIQREWEIACAGSTASGAFFKGTPNLIFEFKKEVYAVLKNRKEYLIERREIELRRLREEKKNSKIIIESLLKDIKTKNKTPIPENTQEYINSPTSSEIVFEKLSIKIKFKYRDKFKSIIEELSTSSKNPQTVKDKEFTAIASILYNIGWISKDITFIDWLRTFSEFYHRKLPSYKESQVKNSIDKIKLKVPFLDNIK